MGLSFSVANSKGKTSLMMSSLHPVLIPSQTHPPSHFIWVLKLVNYSEHVRVELWIHLEAPLTHNMHHIKHSSQILLDLLLINHFSLRLTRITTWQIVIRNQGFVLPVVPVVPVLLMLREKFPWNEWIESILFNISLLFCCYCCNYKAT